MIRSNMRRLRWHKQDTDGRKLTYKTMSEETGLAVTTLSRLLDFDHVERVDGKTLDALCDYFGCAVGDILEHVPGEGQK